MISICLVIDGAYQMATLSVDWVSLPMEAIQKTSELYTLVQD